MHKTSEKKKIMHIKASKRKKITMPIKISKRKKITCLTFYAFYSFYAFCAFYSFMPVKLPLKTSFTILLFYTTLFYSFILLFSSFQTFLNYPNNLVYTTTRSTLLNFVCKNLVTSCLFCYVLLFKEKNLSEIFMNNRFNCS